MWRDGRIVRVRIYPGDLAATRAGLSEREREVLRLRFAEDLTESQIAERFEGSEAEVPAGSVAP
jgi:DNA-directed RNA polymerase specialized sigma24 family protein